MEGVYTEYFQKSKVFLYPLLKIKKGIKHVPVQTYIAWENVYATEDCKFLCEYNTDKNPKFKKFSLDYLESHPMYEKHIELSETRFIYIYDFIKFKSDMKRFVKGSYSQFSLETKLSILDFFGKRSKMAMYVQGFLSPEDLHENYASFLGIDLESIQDIYEICSSPDLEKETLIDNNYIIHQLLNRSSISLEK